MRNRGRITRGREAASLGRLRDVDSRQSFAHRFVRHVIAHRDAATVEWEDKLLAAGDPFLVASEPGESGHTWPWLGALGAMTEKVPFGTGITPPGARFHPAMIAQAWMTLERMFPGRPFLGTGSGEALNEVPVGDDWPAVEDQIARASAR